MPRVRKYPTTERKAHKHFFYNEQLEQRIRMYYAMNPGIIMNHNQLITDAVEAFLDANGVPKEIPQ